MSISKLLANTRAFSTICGIVVLFVSQAHAERAVDGVYRNQLGGILEIEGNNIFYTGYWNGGDVTRKQFPLNEQNGKFRYGAQVCEMTKLTIFCRRQMDGQTWQYTLMKSKDNQSKSTPKSDGKSKTEPVLEPSRTDAAVAKAEAEAVKAKAEAQIARAEADQAKQRLAEVSVKANEDAVKTRGIAAENAALQAELAKSKVAAEAQGAKAQAAETEALRARAEADNARNAARNAVAVNVQSQQQSSVQGGTTINSTVINNATQNSVQQNDNRVNNQNQHLSNTNSTKNSQSSSANQNTLVQQSVNSGNSVQNLSNAQISTNQIASNSVNATNNVVAVNNSNAASQGASVQNNIVAPTNASLAPAASSSTAQNASPARVQSVQTTPNSPAILPPAQVAQTSPASSGGNPTSQSGTMTAINSSTAVAANQRIADLKAQIYLLEVVVSEQTENRKTAPQAELSAIDATIRAVQTRVTILKQEFSSLDQNFNTYLTSIKPNDRDLYLTSRRASEIYPRVPYYIPGTSETGEFWVEPTVSDRGEMGFSFQFRDVASSVEKVRGKIEMNLDQIEQTQKALYKLHEWSIVAHEQKLRRNYEKRVVCFPERECPADGERLDGAASTEIRFNVYEDGSTAGRIQRNKGRFIEGYNVSIDSAMLLQAYLNHVIKEAKLEFKSGTQDKKALDSMFK